MIFMIICHNERQECTGIGRKNETEIIFVILLQIKWDIQNQVCTMLYLRNQLTDINSLDTQYTALNYL